MVHIKLFIAFLFSGVLTYYCLDMSRQDFVGPVPGIWFAIIGFFLVILTLFFFVASIAKFLENSSGGPKNEGRLISKPFVIVIGLFLFLVSLWGDYKSFLLAGAPFAAGWPLFTVRWCPYSLKFLLLASFALEHDRRDKKDIMRGIWSRNLPFLIVWLVVWGLCASRDPAADVFSKIAIPGMAFYNILQIVKIKNKRKIE